MSDPFSHTFTPEPVLPVLPYMQVYGVAWSSGDIIGSCIDLDRGEISFYRNGVSLGVAFRNVRAMQVWNL